MAEKETKKDTKKAVKKEVKQSFWLKRISTPVGFVILLAELALAVGIGLVVCL
ncbi:MAG: hypothetical protein PHW77_07585 [Eubacteriales bacterium]|nr:hypothetical protein [Eubacteriales bacterium]